MPRRRFVWSHPFHNVYRIADARVSVRLVVELKPSIRGERRRPVYQWRLYVAGADCGAFRSMLLAEAAVPDDAIHGAAISQPQESHAP